MPTSPEIIKPNRDPHYWFFDQHPRPHPVNGDTRDLTGVYYPMLTSTEAPHRFRPPRFAHTSLRSTDGVECVAPFWKNSRGLRPLSLIGMEEN